MNQAGFFSFLSFSFFFSLELKDIGKEVRIHIFINKHFLFSLIFCAITHE